MEKEQREQRSHLFTVRLWHEALNNGQAEWRGKIQHVVSGEVYYFREWSALIEALQKMLPEPGEPDQTQDL